MDLQKKSGDFTPASLRDWEVAAREELDGADPWKKLTHAGDGWSIKPFYARTDGGTPPPLLSDSKNTFLGHRAWYNCPRIPVQDAKSANKKALESLQQGADGIFFVLETDTDFEILLHSIQWEFCSLNFLAKQKPDALARALFDFISGKNKPESNFHGAFFGNSWFPGVSHASFRFGGVHAEPSGSPVTELVTTFTALSDIFKGDFHAQSENAAISVSIGNDFFLEIAKMRAARKLWAMIHTKGDTGRPLYIHAYSTVERDDDFQPHGNMLKTTSSAVAAVLGGCDALSLLPEDPEQAMIGRIATNVSTILREESHLSKVADPIAGSWFVEDLTQQLVSAAWERIQKLLR